MAYCNLQEELTHRKHLSRAGEPMLKQGWRTQYVSGTHEDAALRG